MSLADDADFWSQIRNMIRSEVERWHDGGSIVAEDGIIMDGSYNPKDGTVSVGKVETASIISNGTEQPLPIQGVQLLAPVHGQQGGPIGGERVILMRRHSGWLAIMEHGEDDSPGAPAGEHHYLHKTGSFYKYKNNGDVSLHANAAHQVTAASSAHTVTGNETHTAQNFSATASTSASLIAPSTQVGPSGGPYLNIGGGGLGSDYAVIRKIDLITLITWLTTHTHSGVQGGTSTSGAPMSPPPSVNGSPTTSTG